MKINLSTCMMLSRRTITLCKQLYTQLYGNHHATAIKEAKEDKAKNLTLKMKFTMHEMDDSL